MNIREFLVEGGKFSHNYNVLFLIELYRSNGKIRRADLQTKLRNNYGLKVHDQTMTDIAEDLEKIGLIHIEKKRKESNYVLTDLGMSIARLLSEIDELLKTITVEDC